MSVKTLIKGCEPKRFKELGKMERADFIYEEIPSMVEFVVKKSHRPDCAEDLNKIFNIMLDPKFAKTIKYMMKKEDEFRIEIGMVSVVSMFLSRNLSKLDAESLEIYDKLLHKLLKPRVKEITKKVKIDEGLLKELLIIVPDKDIISNKKVISIYSQRMLKKMYAMAAEEDIEIDPKTLKKLFKQIFGEEELTKIAISILLEKKETISRFNESQMKMWNVATTFALNTLEKADKKEIKEKLTEYMAVRARAVQNNKDGARRIQLSQLVAEDYPKLSKAVSKLGIDD